MIEWMWDQDNVITNDELEQEFGPISDEPLGEIVEWSDHVAPFALKERVDIVFGAAPSGLEALRRVVRRWDPLS